MLDFFNCHIIAMQSRRESFLAGSSRQVKRREENGVEEVGVTICKEMVSEGGIGQLGPIFLRLRRGSGYKLANLSGSVVKDLTMMHSSC